MQTAPSIKSKIFNNNVGMGGGTYLHSQMLSHNIIFGQGKLKISLGNQL